MPADLFDPNTHFTILEEGRRELKASVLAKFQAVLPEGGRMDATIKVDSYEENDVEHIAAAYANTTTRFPKIRVIKGPAKLQYSELFSKILADGEEPLDFVRARIEEGGSKCCVFLMEYLPGIISVRELIDERDARLRFIMDNPAVFVDLGRMIPVDLFFANNDRIVRVFGDEDIQRNWDESSRWVLRLTNVFFFAGTFNATDFLSPNNEPFQDLSRSLQRQLTEAADFPSLTIWPGKHLKSSAWEQTKSAMSRDLIQFINICIGRVGNPHGVRFGEPHREQLARGLELGRSALKEHLRGWYSSGRRRRPVGIATRMQALHW